MTLWKNSTMLQQEIVLVLHVFFPWLQRTQYVNSITGKKDTITAGSPSFALALFAAPASGFVVLSSSNRAFVSTTHSTQPPSDTHLHLICWRTIKTAIDGITCCVLDWVSATDELKGTRVWVDLKLTHDKKEDKEEDGTKITSVKKHD